MRKSLVVLLLIVIGALLIVKFTTKTLPTGLGNSISTDFKNISYNIEGKDVLLNNGYAETEFLPGSASKNVTKFFGDRTWGDFNGDGGEDVIFLLTQDGGGSGLFYYAVAALKVPGGYVGTNGIFLGDRIAPQNTEFRDGKIIVNYAERNPGEPITTKPSVGVSKYLKVVDNKLISE